MQAVRGRHLPKSTQEAEEARQRLAFEELLVLQLRLILQRTRMQCAPCPCSSCFCGLQMLDSMGMSALRSGS